MLIRLMDFSSMQREREREKERERERERERQTPQVVRSIEEGENEDGQPWVDARLEDEA